MGRVKCAYSFGLKSVEKTLLVVLVFAALLNLHYPLFLSLNPIRIPPDSTFNESLNNSRDLELYELKVITCIKLMKNHERHQDFLSVEQIIKDLNESKTLVTIKDLNVTKQLERHSPPIRNQMVCHPSFNSPYGLFLVILSLKKLYFFHYSIYTVLYSIILKPV
jgi:hypothetical protein